MSKYSRKIERDVKYTGKTCCACESHIREGELNWCSGARHMSGPIGPQPVCNKCRATPPKYLKGIYYWEGERDF